MITLKNPVIIPGVSLLTTEDNNVLQAAEIAYSVGGIVSCTLTYGNLTGTVFTPSAILPSHTVDLTVATGYMAVDNTPKVQEPAAVVATYTAPFITVEKLFENWLVSQGLIAGVVS